MSEQRGRETLKKELFMTLFTHSTANANFYIFFISGAIKDPHLLLVLYCSLRTRSISRTSAFFKNTFVISIFKDPYNRKHPSGIEHAYFLWETHLTGWNSKFLSHCDNKYGADRQNVSYFTSS